MDNPSETKDEMESDEDQPTVFSNNLDMMDDDFASIVDGMSGDDGTVQTQINDEDSERYLDTPLSFVQLDRMLKEMFHNEEITKISELRMLLEKEQQEAQEMIGLIGRGECNTALEYFKRMYPSLAHEEIVTKFMLLNLEEMLMKSSVDDLGEQMKCIEYCKNYIAEHIGPSSPDYDRLLNILLLLLRDPNSNTFRLEDARWFDQLERSRANLVESVESFMRIHKRKNEVDSELEILLKYLINIHNIYHILNGVTPALPFIESMLLPERFDAEKPQVLYPVHDRDVITLTQKLSITCEEAKIALSISRGDMKKAIKLEVGRLRLNKCLLFDLVEEYCLARGIIINDSIQESSNTVSKMKKIQQLFESNNFEDIIKSILELDKSLLDNYQVLEFYLYEHVFLNHYLKGEDDKALTVASCHLMPLTLENSSIEEQFQETVSLLGYDLSCRYTNEHVNNVINRIESSKESMMKTLTEIIFEQSTMNYPRLARMLKYLIFCHTKWFIHEVDEMSEYLSISKLNSCDFSSLKQTPKPSAPEILDKRELAITSLMDITQITREEAESLINQHGTVENALSIFFSEEQ